MVIAPARRAGDPGSIPGPGENFSLKLLISLLCSQIFCAMCFIFPRQVPSVFNYVVILHSHLPWYYLIPFYTISYGNKKFSIYPFHA